MKLPIALSNKHIHLSQADIDVLFGQGYELTHKKDLSQPGQFACEEMVEVVGPKGSTKMRVLGPARPESQVEVSLADARGLGIAVPVRQSGDTEGTPGCKLVGPKGEVEMTKGVIVAARHIHMSLEDAEKFGVKDVLVCTYQAISGAGKTFETWPDMVDNVIPYIGGEEEKSEKEPLKLWGKIDGSEIKPADKPNFTAQCIRVPVSNGHLGAVFVNFDKMPKKEEMIEIWKNFKGRAQELELPSAPKQFLNYFTEDDRPQIKSERMLENGMAISIGRLREDTQYQYKFVCLSHNTLRGAAGGGVLLAELLCAEGYMD